MVKCSMMRYRQVQLFTESDNSASASPTEMWIILHRSSDYYRPDFASHKHGCASDKHVEPRSWVSHHFVFAERKWCEPTLWPRIVRLGPVQDNGSYFYNKETERVPISKVQFYSHLTDFHKFQVASKVPSG